MPSRVVGALHWSEKPFDEGFNTNAFVDGMPDVKAGVRQADFAERRDRRRRRQAGQTIEQAV